MTILIVSFAVIILGLAAFSCCLAAEFNKSKAKDMEIDGSLCFLQRSPAFGLGIAAIVCLSVAQIAGTTVAATRLFSGAKSKRSNLLLPILLLVLSWISFGLAAIFLATGTSMNDRQLYGRGWLNAECYLVKDGVFIGSAVLSVATIVFILGFTFTTSTERMTDRTGPDEERNPRPEELQKQASFSRQ